MVFCVSRICRNAVVRWARPALFSDASQLRLHIVRMRAGLIVRGLAHLSDACALRLNVDLLAGGFVGHGLLF